MIQTCLEMPGTSLAVGSVSEKRRKSRKKHRWQPYPSKKWLKSPSGRLESVANRFVSDLPDELIVKVLSSLNVRDITVCKRVNRHWKTLIDKYHLQALSYSQCHHYHQPRPQTIERYHACTRDCLAGFISEGREVIGQLDELLRHRYFPEILFFSIAKVLTNAGHLNCQNVYTFRHSDLVNNASFSPDGRYLATASNDNTAKIWEFVAGQWEEKATIRHSSSVKNVSFSPDGRHLVTASEDFTAKIWGLVAEQWQEKTTVRHAGWVVNASFSPDSPPNSLMPSFWQFHLEGKNVLKYIKDQKVSLGQVVNKLAWLRKPEDALRMEEGLQFVFQFDDFAFQQRTVLFLECCSQNLEP